MKIAVQNPMFSGMSGLHGWIAEFLRIYAPAIYVSDIRYLPRLAYFFYHYRLNPLRYKLLFSEEQLRTSADVLLCFNGRPYRKENKPVQNFPGLKIHHVMDYTFFPEESSKALRGGGVQYVLGYSQHDKYCDLFRAFYPDYVGKVIPVPFGFADRFADKTPFAERKNKVLALGAVNSFFGAAHDIPALKTTNNFFLEKGEKFMHKFRRMLVEHERGLAHMMDSKLPHYPQTADFSYDLPSAFNEYRMFVSCESLQYFPPAKTYEGPAAGCVLVCSEHPCFRDLGFEHGVNCIMHKEFDIQDFRDKVSYFISHEEELARIQKNATAFVQEHYTHRAVAERLYGKIKKIFEGGTS